MKLRLKTLRNLLSEILYKASAPERLKLPDVEVEADNTRDAGMKASEMFRSSHGVAGLDPFSISVDQIEQGPIAGIATVDYSGRGDIFLTVPDGQEYDDEALVSVGRRDAGIADHEELDDDHENALKFRGMIAIIRAQNITGVIDSEATTPKDGDNVISAVDYIVDLEGLMLDSYDDAGVDYK